MMDDAALAEFLGIGRAKERGRILSGISPEQRAVYERMLETEEALMRHLAGRGPKPAGVVVCDRRKR